jgi:hypothetical protein
MPLEHIEFLLEEPSSEEALNNLVPRIIGTDVTFQTHVFQGKADLLDKLQQRLLGYSYWLPDNWGIVVLIDEDREDCHALKSRIERTSQAVRLTTKSSVQGTERFQVLNRIAVEELEAWFFGDIDALASAYQGVSATLAMKAKYRDPDDIRGGTWEALESLLRRLGHHRGGLEKMRAAREISAYMDPEVNRSGSFQVFRDGLRALAGQQNN